MQHSNSNPASSAGWIGDLDATLTGFRQYLKWILGVHFENETRFQERCTIEEEIQRLQWFNYVWKMKPSRLPYRLFWKQRPMQWISTKKDVDQVSWKGQEWPSMEKCGLNPSSILKQHTRSDVLLMQMLAMDQRKEKRCVIMKWQSPQ